ncbi:MAG: redoxin domain-containing protein, partial [Bacteroidales bacterium]|nr:redoxin domain-containing protein [Bacteroidales bacterium]
MKYSKNTTTVIMLIMTLFYTVINLRAQADHPTLQIGQMAPDFLLPGIDGKDYSLKDFDDNKFLVILFTCNHCPTAQSYEDRIIQLVDDYQGKGVGFLAVSPND